MIVYNRHHTACKYAFPFRCALFVDQRKNLHVGVVIMDHFSSGPLPDQFAKGRICLPVKISDNIPLGSRRQRYAHTVVQILQAVKWKAVAIF
jgi:hypothetical protein